MTHARVGGNPYSTDAAGSGHMMHARVGKTRCVWPLRWPFCGARARGGKRDTACAYRKRPQPGLCVRAAAVCACAARAGSYRRTTTACAARAADNTREAGVSCRALCLRSLHPGHLHPGYLHTATCVPSPASGRLLQAVCHRGPAASPSGGCRREHACGAVRPLPATRRLLPYRAGHACWRAVLPAARQPCRKGT